MAAIEWITLAILPAFLGLDLIRRSRRFDAPRWWRLRATVVSVLTLGLSIGVALFWASVFDVAGGAVVGILIYELLHYWYHRAAHRVPLLWRAAHQMHHSAESVDAFGAYYLHPVDTFLFTTWSSLVFFPLLGLDALAGAMAALFVTFNAVFQHANIRTPHWLGYLIQRPEMHGVHHAREVHQHNYSDLPLWDMVFGTYKNPHRRDVDRQGRHRPAHQRGQGPAGRGPAAAGEPARQRGAGVGPRGLADLEMSHALRVTKQPQCRVPRDIARVP
jgi:sterol desaturase/sphingolipid hydroxylase (fatty acid hydroxylase superfamily)